ncbi:hypothetical protein [Halotalea alkalilenta]|uniref:hypothetical protein n=1 Tax=Halotalea alkalilenta TaxID=376489 RepID=UPI0012DF235F|nr:hypothetical protein [Halotalea alkalilenta]
MSNRRRLPFVSDIHYLLGSTLRDSRQDRIGRVVGLDQHRERPIIDVLWSGERRVERVEISAEQLEALMRVARERAAGQGVEVVDEPRRQAHSPDESESRLEKPRHEAVDERAPLRRRA